MQILRQRTGAGLVEILVALLIFGLGIGMAMRLLPETTTATTRGRNLTKATNLAQQKLEELVGLDYEDTDLSSGTHNDVGNPLDVHFNRSWVVVADSPAPGMKSVTVTVSFPSVSSDSVATLTSIMTKSRW
jgi:type II secretory pathway pseudopilin PulG